MSIANVVIIQTDLLRMLLLFVENNFTGYLLNSIVDILFHFSNKLDLPS